jgi:protein-tyrosine kinase
MSTIEKAVEKLERDSTSSAPASEKASVAKDSPAPRDAVEQQVASALEQEQAKLPGSAIESAHVADVVRSDTVSVDESPRTTESNPIMIQVPVAELAERGMLTPLTPRSNLAEEFRAIKRPLLRNISGVSGADIEHPNLIMVTSALQGDGKTFTAINLAMSIAMEQDSTVLFVDADVAKASAGTTLGVSTNHSGLIDVLENKGVTLSDVILPTDIPNLRIMPAGVLHERSTEILAGQRMRDLMLEMSSRYTDRVIIFDSPPLLLTSEASVLASFMGQIVFVASTDETPSEAVTEALERINGDKVIGMVLNKAHSRRSKFMGLSYGYGYGYGAGYGYGDGDRGVAQGKVD